MFSVNNNNHKGMLFISSTYGATTFLVYNELTSIAVLDDARSNKTGIGTTQLQSCKLKELKAKLNQLENQGYQVIDAISATDTELSKALKKLNK